MKSTRSQPILNLFTLFTLLASLLGGAVIVTPVLAASQNALDFDGSDDYVRIANPYTGFTDQITVEAWVYFDGGSDGIWMGQSGADIDAMSTNVWLWHSCGDNCIEWFVNNGGSWLGTNTSSSNGWHHIATVAGNSGLQIYVDGTLSSSNGSSLTNVQNVLTAIMDIGKDPRYSTGFGRNASQKMDELRIWNVVRTQTEIQANMNSEMSPQAGLVEYYRFNQGVVDGDNTGVTTALDNSGNSRDGMLNNFALTGSTSNWVGGLVFDGTAPVVHSFTAITPSSSLNVAISAFTASDAVGVTGYMITESSTAPAASDSGWSGSAPTTYTVGAEGNYTLYPWAKDAAGNVSAVFGSPASVSVDTCASSITVTSNADSGPGTLRQAIADACVGDINNISIIDFDSALSGDTIHLASTLTISKNMTIDGSDLAEPITISGDDNVRVFDIPTIPLTSIIVTLDNLIVTKGVTSGHGAGLFMGQGTHVTIKNSIFSDNHAEGRGGGIGNQGSLTLIDSTISGNSSASTDGGGGISNESGITITNSTISNNHATGAGASGGGLFNTGGATITNSTIFGNSTTTYGGGISTTANLTITNSTIAGNSAAVVGGLLVQGNVTHLRNTIIANNTSTTINSFSHHDCTDISDYPAPPSADGDGIMTNVNNLIEHSNCSPALSGDPKLGPLVDNGGSTQTLALLPGSPAINAGDNTTCPATDQRGLTRPQGSHCDIGGYEAKHENVDLILGSTNIGTYSILPGIVSRQSFVGVNNGPMQILSSNSIPLIGAERVIYKAAGGTNTSFSEMMALPDSQLDTIYWLPWYNNVDLDTQLRFGNVSGSTATVHVYIGEVEMTGSPFTLAPGASTRQSFAGINNGPVKIESDIPIVAAERVIYKVNGVNTSFSEMMALPDSQLDTTYWLPWYNNVDLDTQLRFGNVSGSTATVNVYIGGTLMTPTPITLLSGQSIRQSFPSINNGPVEIISDVPIVAAERVIYKVNGVNTSFSETMALPDSQLDTTFWFPWYNNVDLDTQLRFANASGSTATVHVYIGDVEMTGSPFTLATGTSTRVSFPGISNGPVQIVSDQNIVAAERVIYKIDGTNTSFSEMMGLPDSQLDTTYWLPWYNNVDLDTQLRFGVP